MTLIQVALAASFAAIVAWIYIVVRSYWTEYPAYKDLTVYVFFVLITGGVYYSAMHDSDSLIQANLNHMKHGTPPF